MHPYPNKQIAVAIAGTARLLLGVELYDAGAKNIVLFAESQADLEPIDTLFFNEFSNEKDKRHRPFWWNNYKERCGQRRDDVKRHLSNLGFDPSIVDQVFPPKPSP